MFGTVLRAKHDRLAAEGKICLIIRAVTYDDDVQPDGGYRV